MSNLDLKRFVETCGPDDGAVAEIVNFYLTYMAGQLDALHAAIAGQCVKDVELIAHRCAGSSATFGMQSIVAPLAAIERQARDGRVDGALALEGEARGAFAEIETALRGLVARQAPQP